MKPLLPQYMLFLTRTVYVPAPLDSLAIIPKLRPLENLRLRPVLENVNAKLDLIESKRVPQLTMGCQNPLCLQVALK